MPLHFLTLEDCLAIHANQVELHGGDPGMRDITLLESAISQPPATFAGDYLHGDLYEMAAGYLFHIVRNHPFLDGNKRTGAVAALVFLDFHAIEISAPEGALFDLVIAVASGEVGKEEVADFFRRQARTR
jgi:death-on-curing protein